MAQTNFFEEESVSKRLINTSVGVLVDFHYSLLAFQHSGVGVTPIGVCGPPGGRRTVTVLALASALPRVDRRGRRGS